MYMAQRLVEQSSGIAKTRQMAADHARAAAEAVLKMPATLTQHAETCRRALIEITERVLTRKK